MEVPKRPPVTLLMTNQYHGSIFIDQTVPPIIIMMRYIIPALNFLSLLDARNFKADANREGVLSPVRGRPAGVKRPRWFNQKETHNLCGVGNAANNYDDRLVSTGANWNGTLKLHRHWTKDFAYSLSWIRIMLVCIAVLSFFISFTIQTDATYLSSA